MDLPFRKKSRDCIGLLVLLTALCSSCKVSAQVFSNDEEATDVELIVYSAALLQNSLVQVLGQMLQNPEVGTRLSWEQAAKLSWLQKNLISHRLSTLSMVPTAQRLLLRPTVISPEEQLTLILHEACLNYWDDAIPIHTFKIHSVLTALPKALRKVNVLHLVSTARCTNIASFLDVVFKKLKLGTILLSSSLLYGILQTYPFACIPPDFQEALDYVSKEIIYKANILNSVFVRIPLQKKDLKALLLDILKFLVSNQSPLSLEAKLRIQIILPYLSMETCKYMYTYGVSVNTNYDVLFSALKDSDYPADIKDVKYTLTAALNSKELDFKKYLVGFDPGLYGSNRLSLLLAYLQRLYISLPNAHPASAYVSTLLPYVKFKYIASKGGSYMPRTSFDIAVLLNAFNTIGELSEAKTELYKALTKDIQWKSMLRSFPYNEYTDPRSLLISMVQSILSHNQGYKLCHKLIMQYFLEKASNVTQGCSSALFNDKHNKTYAFPIISKPIDILVEPTKNVSLYSKVAYKLGKAAIKIPVEYTRQNQNTTSEYTFSTIKTPFNEHREIQQIKCKVNGTIYGDIKSVIDIFHYLEAEKMEVFPMYLNIECTDSNQKKLYLSTSRHPKCNTAPHLPITTEPKITNGEKPLTLTAHHTKIYSLETAPFTVKDKGDIETIGTSASITADEEMSAIISDNLSVEPQTKESVPTTEPTTVVTPVFSRPSSTSENQKHKLEQKNTIPKVMDIVTLTTHETTYIPKESSLEGQDSIKKFNTLNTIKGNKIGFTSSETMITKEEILPPTYAAQIDEPIREVTIPFQAEKTQDYNSITIFPNTPSTTKRNVFITTFTKGSGIYTGVVNTKQVQTMKAEHTVEPTVIENRDTESFRQGIISTSSHTGAQTVPIATTHLPNTVKSLKSAEVAYSTEVAEWKAETTEISVSNEQVLTIVVPETNSPSKTSLQSALPTNSSTNIFITGTSNVTDCVTLPNIVHILTNLNVSQESVNIIQNIILTPEAYSAFKYFKFSETELPREILTRLLSFMKYYADLNNIAIRTINEVLSKINADSSMINEHLKIINICMNTAGVIHIRPPSAMSKTMKELSSTTGYKAFHITTKEMVQTVAEEATTHLEEISTSLPEKTEMKKHEPVIVTFTKPLEYSLIRDYVFVTTTFVPQLQNASSSITEETIPIRPTLGSVSFPTIKEQVNKKINIMECIKVPDITSLLTAVPDISTDSISIVIHYILKPEFLISLKHFRLRELEVPITVFIRFLNFIKYYTKPSPKIIRAIDDILMDIDTISHPVKLILSFIEVCITEDGKMKLSLPTLSSLKSLKDNISTSGDIVNETTHDNIVEGENKETLNKSEEISISTTETLTEHLQETMLPMISNIKIATNKASNIRECLELPNVTFLLTRLNVSQEYVFLIENIILTPEVLLALKHFKFMENESLRSVLIRLLHFVKYYAELNIMDIKTIDKVLSKINLVSSIKNEPLRAMGICLDRADVKQMSPNVTSLKPLKLSLTTDSVSTNMFTDKEIMHTGTLEAIPQNEYISISIPETTLGILEEISPTSSNEQQELISTNAYKAPYVKTVKEMQTSVEEATAQTKKTSTFEPKMALTTASLESPELSMITGYKTMHMTAKEEVAQTVTEKATTEMEYVFTSVPEITTTANEISSFFTKLLEHSLITSYNTSDVTTDKEIVHTLTADAHTDKETVHTLTADAHTDKEIVHTLTADAHTEKISTFTPETTARIVNEISSTSIKSLQMALTTGYKDLNVSSDKEATQTVTEDAMILTEKISTFMPETTARIMNEMSLNYTKALELSSTVDHNAVNVITDKEAANTVTKDAMIHTEKILTSTKPLELSLTTDHNAAKVISNKEVLYTETEDARIHNEKIATSLPERTARIVDEMPLTSIKPLELSLTTGYNVITDKDVHTATKVAMINTKKLSISVPETTVGIEQEMSPTSMKLLEHSLTTGYKAVNVITGKEIIYTVTKDAMTPDEKIPTSIPETTAGIEQEISLTSIKPLEHSLSTDYRAVNVITNQEAVHTSTEAAIINIEKIPIPETTVGIVDEMSATSMKPLEVSLIKGYDTLNVITEKPIVQSIIRNTVAQTTAMPTSVSVLEKTSIQPVNTTSTQSMQLSFTSYVVPQSEQISNSVMKFTDKSPSLVHVYLPSGTELINETNVIDCIKLPNMTSLLTSIPPESREQLLLFLKYFLQPEFLKPLKQFKFMEKEAPAQVLKRFLKFIKLYTEPNSKLSRAIDDVFLHISNNVNSVPLNIMNICINKETAGESKWTIKTTLEPTKAFGLYINEKFNASLTSTLENSLKFTGKFQGTTNSPSLHIHTDTIASEKIPTKEEFYTSIETTTELSTEWDESEILQIGANLTTLQYKSSKPTEESHMLETFSSTLMYPEAEKITNIKLTDHSVASHGLQTARKATEIKPITASVEYQSTMVATESDILISTATTELERKTLETVTLKQSSLASQNLQGITATPKELISSETGTIKPIKENTVPNADVIINSSTHLETTSTMALSGIETITATEFLGILGEKTYKPLATESPITDIYLTKIPRRKITKAATISTINEMSKEITEQATKIHMAEVTTEPLSATENSHVTKAITENKTLKEIKSIEKHNAGKHFVENTEVLSSTPIAMTKIQITSMDSTPKIEYGRWTMDMTSEDSKITSTGMAVTQELTETTHKPAETEIIKILTETSVIKEEANRNTIIMYPFSLSESTKAVPQDSEQHWTAPSILSDVVTQKTFSLTHSNILHPASTVSSTLSAEVTIETAINSSKIICIDGNYSLQTNTQEMDETKECIKIPDISILLNINKHLFQDLLNALSRILCRSNVLSLLKSFEIPELSNAANAIRRFLMFLKYNVNSDVQTMKVVSEIMKKIDYDSLALSGVVLKEICFNPTVSTLAYTFSPKYPKAPTLPTEIFSEVTDILPKDTKGENEQTNPSITSSFTDLKSSIAAEHTKATYDHTLSNVTYFQMEQTFEANANYETSKSTNRGITFDTDSSLPISSTSPVSTSKKSTSLPQVVSTSVPTQLNDDELYRLTLPNLTNIIHNEERKAYTIYPYIIEHQPSASWHYAGDIIVPKECPHVNMTHMLIIDVISLFEVLDSQVPNRSLKHLIEAISIPETKKELKILDWTRYNNKHTFLKDVFKFLIINSTYVDNIKNELISALNHIRSNSNDELPTFKFICIPKVHFPINNSSGYKNISVLKIITKEHCNASNSKVVISIPIAPLLKCIDYYAPRLVKTAIKTLLSRDDISALLSYFNALNYKTNGELLHALLTYLSYIPSLEDNVLRSIRTLLRFIKYDGYGALAPTLITECIDTNEIKDMVYTSPYKAKAIEHKQKVSSEAYSTKATKHTLSFQIEECTENKTHLFVIDVTALFQAVKPEVGLQKHIMNILDRPEIQIKLKELPWERYDTKAELLSDVLAYILSKSTQSELSVAIKMIASNIQFDGPGTERPVFKFICVDFGKIYLDEMEGQTHYLRIPTDSVCNNDSKVVLLINIDSLMQTLKQEVSPLVKATTIALFQRKDFYKKISNLKLETSMPSGMALKKILTHLVAHGELETPPLRPVKELLKHIQLDGPGARQLEIRKECQSTDFSPLWDDFILNEEEKTMIIPFQCSDNLTLSGRFTVDIPSLFLGINTPTTIKSVDKIHEYFKTFKGQQLLAKFKWEFYETRGKMLKDLLHLVASTFSDDDNIYVAIQKLLPLLDVEDSESLPLVLKFECDANATNTIKDRNIQCENNSTPLWVANITSLFKALNNDTPEMPKQLLGSYLSRLDVYKDLVGFDVLAYNTKSKLLWKMMTYIMLQNSLSYKLHSAAAELVTYINWDEPGMEKIDAHIMCNITSEKLHLDFASKNININQEKSIIKISSQCHENGTMNIVDVDATLLIKILPKVISSKIYNISELLHSSRIKNKLKEFKWGTHQEANSEVLKQVLIMLFKAIPLEGNVLNQVDKYIHKFNSIIETAVPLLSYRCINSRENYSHILANITQDKQVHEITGELAIMQPTYGKCSNENNNSGIPIILVNIANLFKALKPNTSVLAKAVIISHMTQTEFYKQITGFHLEAYKTRGEQLQQLLAFLATTTSDSTLLKAIAKLLENVLLDGPGKLPSVYRIVCNISLNYLFSFKSRSNETSEILDTLVLGKNVHHSFAVLEPCIEGSSGMTYKIDIPSLFYALKSEAPQESLAKLAAFIAKPNFQIQLKRFEVIHHKTQGSLLHAMLSFVSKKADTPSNVVQAIEDILPFVHSVALGKKTPKITLNCSLPDFQELIYDKQAMDMFPEQRVNIVNQEGLPCDYITSDSQIIKGRTVYIFDIPRMMNILAVTDHEKKLFMTLLKSSAFQEHLKVSDFRFSTNNAKTLEYLLLSLQENLNLQKNEIEIMQKMISKIREIHEAYIPSVIIMKCITDTTLKEFPVEATNQTCFLPLQYNHTGITYDIQWDSLLEAMSPQTPSQLLRKLERFLNFTHRKIHLEGFNIFQYRTRGTLLKDLLVFLALKPSLSLEYKKLMSSLVSYVQLHGIGSFAPTVTSDCPKSDTQNVTESTDSATEMLYTTTLSDPCFSDPNSILINQFNVTSLFTTLDKEAPSLSVSEINNYLQDYDIQEKLHGFDVKKYETKNDFLQGLLAFIWSDKNNPETVKIAAKTLLPHIMFNATEEPPILKTACYVPKKFYIRYTDVIPKSLILVYPTKKICLHSVAHIPGIIVYRITISTLFKALHPKLQVEEYLPVANFLNKPYAYKYVQGINIDRYKTRGELLRAVLTFLRFSQKYMEDGMKDALIKLLPLIQLDGLGSLPVDKYTECSPVLEEDKSSSLQLQDVLKAIEQTSLNPESHDAYLTIFDFLTSPGFNLTHYISWLDEKRTLTNGELLKIILLQLYDKNPNMGKGAMLLMPYVEEQKGIGGKRAKIETYRFKEMLTPYEINFLELLKVIKPEAPKHAVSYMFNLFGKQDIYKDLKNFDPDEHETQGDLLVGILKFLEEKYKTNSTIGTYIKQLIPFVDMTNIGALPPIVKTIYITFNTSVSVFRLDLIMLYKLFPKEKLTQEQQQALNEIFKFLSTKGYRLPELFQGLSSRFPSHIQIKLILEKLKLKAEGHLKAYANDMLEVLEENMPRYTPQNELIPEMDWIEVLHAIPDSDVPSEVIASKKELYRFFLSASFKIIIKHYRVNLSISRGKFLKDLLSYLRRKPEVSNIKVLKRAIAYVFMFIREVGAGEMSVQDDIILPEQQEEARSARNRIKELLYQVLGLIQQEGAFEILQTLQRLFDSTTKLNLVTTYLGYDVLEEFPPKERLITILRRIYHNFIMFLDQDTVSAIDMVFISLGETKQQTSEILHFLPVDMETLLKTVLGPDTPPLVVAASDFIRSNINLNTIPLGKAFQDTVPSILNLNVRKRLTVILRILWRVFSKYDDAKIHQSIRTVYEYLQPNKLGNELNTQEHHMAVIAALKGLIRSNSPKKVENAKNIVVEQLVNQQNVYDKVLAHLVTQNLSPKQLIAKALRRFREHQLRMNPKLWSAVSVIFDFLHVPEHESLEQETECNINIVDEFRYLVDEAGIDVEPAKRILMKYIIDKKPELHKLFRAQHVLLQYPQAEKIAIILNRLLRIYGENLEPEIFSAASIILNHLDVLVNEVDINKISMNEIFNSVVNESAPKNVIKAKKVVQDKLNNATVLYQVLQTVIIQKDFTPERQLVTILRQFYNIFKPQLKKNTLQFLITLFDYLKVSLDSSVEDQFVGNFTFKPIFKHIFPESEVPEYVTQAVNTILSLLSSEQVDIKQLLYGVHLWKLPVVSQVSIILYRLTKIPYINKEVRHSIDTLLEGLGVDSDELANEDIDESYTPGKLFNEAIGNKSISPELQEAKGIVMKVLLSGSSKVKNIYRGIDFKNIPQPKDRLVAILKNMYNKRSIFGEKMTEALDVISTFLQVDLGKQKIDPYTFDFDGILEQVVPISAPISVRQARNLFLKAVKNRPGTFKKILDHVNVTDYETENEVASKILNETQNYNRPLSKHLRIATNLILDYLHGVPIKEELNSANDDNSKEDTEAEEDGIGFKMFEDESKLNRKWKTKKKLRRYD